MTLTVLNVAYSLGVVGPAAVGGAEQVLSRLDDAIVTSGHRSITVACEGSEVCGELVATPAVSEPITETSWSRGIGAHREAIQRVLAAEPVDVVHLHGVDCMAYLPAGDVPVLITLHLPPAWYPPELFRIERENVWINPVSESQRRACPPSPRLIEPILNGVPAPDVHGIERENFALVMGRICPEKGFHLAIDAARAAGVPLVMAGRVFEFPEHVAYFEREIAPRLGPGVTFLGPVVGERKERLLAAARCVLVPSLAPETSSLVSMEAAMAGTPVVAFDVGALPEAIEHRGTGFIVRDVQEMARAIRRVGQISRATCRQHARQRFSLARMTDQYLRLYSRLAQQRSGGTARITTDVIRDEAGLVEIARDWLDLWRRCGDATPFQTPDWMLAWWRQFGGCDLHVITVRADGRLMGLAPLMIYDDGGTRRATLLAAGLSDHAGPLLADGWERAAARAIVAHVERSGEAWDVLEIEEMPAGSALLDVHVSETWRRTVDSQSACPCIELPQPWRGVEEIISANLSRDLRRCMQRAGEIGPVRFETAREPGRVRQLMEMLIDLHGARWRSEGETGVLDDRRVQAMHHEVAQRFASLGILRLHAMHIGGRIAACFYGFEHRGRLYCYLTGMSPELAQCGPGKLILAYAIDEAGRRGAACVDMLRGCEAYKYRWGARDEVTYRWRMEPQRERAVDRTCPEVHR